MSKSGATTEHTPSEAELMKARHHLTVVAHGLATMFSPRLAAALMLGGAAGVVEEELGGHFPTWLRELADEYEANPGVFDMTGKRIQ